MEHIIDIFAQEKVCAILRVDDARKARQAMEVCVRAGFRILEFTLTIPDVYACIESFAHREGILVGAGTILSKTDLDRAHSAGARFFVSPVFDEDLVRYALEKGYVFIPGVQTPSEMWRAHQLGVKLLKVFPYPAEGPAYIRSILGPMPFLKLMPTNGVTRNNVREFFKAGVFAVGLTTSLFVPQFLEHELWYELEDHARSFLEEIRLYSQVFQ